MQNLGESPQGLNSSPLRGNPGSQAPQGNILNLYSAQQQQAQQQNQNKYDVFNRFPQQQQRPPQYGGYGGMPQQNMQQQRMQGGGGKYDAFGPSKGFSGQ